MTKEILLFCMLSLPLTCSAWQQQSESKQIKTDILNAGGTTRTGSAYQTFDSVGEVITGQTYGSQYSNQAGFFNDYFMPPPTATPIAASERTLKVWNGQINPSRGEQARIRWYQANDNQVTLTIYNLLGDKVTTLIKNQKFASGTIREVTWQGKNSNDNIVASGIYIVYLQSGDYKAWTKIAVVK